MKLLLIPILFFLILGFQNCGQYQASDFKSEAPIRTADCDIQSLEYFESTFYKSFREVGCNNCHSQSSLLTFADDDLDVAYSSFSERSASNFVNKISLESHQQSVLNYDKGSLEASFSMYAEGLRDLKLTCDPLTDLAHTTDLQAAQFFDEPGGASDSRCGFNDPIKLEHISSPYSSDQPQTDLLEWDLGLEDPRLDGVVARLEVSPENPQGFPIGAELYACPNQDGYQVGNLRFVSTKNKVRLKNVSVVLNGSDQENLHFFGVDLELGPSDGEVYMLGGAGGFTIYTMVGSPVLKTDSWQLQIETIQQVQ